jgi:hypothetical protein
MKPQIDADERRSSRILAQAQYANDVRTRFQWKLTLDLHCNRFNSFRREKIFPATGGLR